MKTIGGRRLAAEKGKERAAKKAGERLTKQRKDKKEVAKLVRLKVKKVKEEIKSAKDSGLVSERIKILADRFARGKLDLSNPQQAELVKNIVDTTVLDKYNMSPKRTMQEYFFLALSNIGDYVNWEKDGKMYLKPKEELTREQLSAIREINTRRDSNGNYFVVKFKFHDKLEALKDIAKHYGLFEKDNIQKAPSLDLEKVIGSLPVELEDFVRTRLVKELSKYENESQEENDGRMGLSREGQRTIN